VLDRRRGPGAVSTLPVLGPPRTRGDCAGVPRPCPWRACRFNLTTERHHRPGGLSCALDVADQGGSTLAEIGVALGVTRERVRQIQVKGLRHLATAMVDRGLLTPREAARVPELVRELLTADFAAGGRA
jgi:hypothetical protein